jgi:hypothetical protein
MISSAGGHASYRNYIIFYAPVPSQIPSSLNISDSQHNKHEPSRRPFSSDTYDMYGSSILVGFGHKLNYFEFLSNYK